MISKPSNSPATLRSDSLAVSIPRRLTSDCVNRNSAAGSAPALLCPGRRLSSDDSTNEASGKYPTTPLSRHCHLLPCRRKDTMNAC